MIPFIFLLICKQVCLTLAQEIPTDMKIAIEPEDVREMEIIQRPLMVYLSDINGKLVANVSGTWNCEVSLVTGAGGSLVGTTTASFINGTASFPNLFITEAGSGYILQFSITFPADNGIPLINSTTFDVGPRPLGLRLSENPEMRAAMEKLTVAGKIWDEAQDLLADEDTLTGLSWECDLFLEDKNLTLEGITKYQVPSGADKFMFDNIMIRELAKNQQFRVECFSPEYSGEQPLIVKSSPFIVYDYPKTALLRQTVVKVKFEGPYNLVESAIEKYKAVRPKGKATCVGCPPGMLPKPRDIQRSGEEEPLADWDPCTAPIYLNEDLSCGYDSLNLD